ESSKDTTMIRVLLVASLACTPALLLGQLAERPLLIEARVPKPPTIASGGDGNFLVYEVHVTNFEGRELTWTGLDATDAANGATLFALSDTALARDMARPGATGSQVAPQNRPRLAGGQRAFVYLYFALGAGQRPAAIRHRLTMTDSTGARTLVMRDVPVTLEPAVIGPPLKGGNWLAGNGPARTSGHRRALIPINGTPAIAQRFAIDYVMLDSAGRTFRGDRLKNESYYAEGVDAIAIADGIVVATKDSIPENIPGATSRAVPITLETVGGNHVILDIGGGRYAFYAHLKPGSLRVKLGERVRRGAVVGLVGNSGNSTEPHLHFHLSDGNSPLGSEGVPYVHETLDVLGRCQSIAGGCSVAAAQSRRRVMPLQNEIVQFPR
ncbi:MAG: M23 family metallopeptidase, partial [Gemmatimonadaceae bacterium]